MSLTSPQKSGLNDRLLEVELLFRERKPDAASKLLANLTTEGFEPHGFDRGFFQMLLAEKAMVESAYEEVIAHCLEAQDNLASSSLNYRFGRIQFLLSKAHSALGNLKQSELAARDALSSYRRVNDPMGIIDTYNELGRIYFIRGEYAQAAEYVNEALQIEYDDPVKTAQLLGNLGRIYLLTGDLQRAEENLTRALDINEKQETLISIARNRLSLGYLHLRRRRFDQAEAEFEIAARIIETNNFKRDHIIYLEYVGELAFEKQDYVSAREYLRLAEEEAKQLAPESALRTQILRRLAEVNLELGHSGDAMTLAQQGLDLAQKLGEQAEIALSHRVIARIFMKRNEHADARRHALDGITILREIGDNFELGRSIIEYGRIPLSGISLSDRKSIPLLQEADDIFTVIGDDFYLAECRFETGRTKFQMGKNGEALEYLTEALKGYKRVNDDAGVQKVREFMVSLSRDAVRRALSQENEFKIFGNVISDTEYKDLRSGRLDRLMDILVQRTSADRAVLVTIPEEGDLEIASAHGLQENQYDRFLDDLSRYISDRTYEDGPTLVLDCSNETNASGAFGFTTAPLASMLVLPLVSGMDIVGYIYLDRIINGKGFNPFNQNEIDFAVGFADLAAMKTSEFQKSRLIEDNLRLREQLQQSCAFPNIITQSRPFMEMLSRVRQVSDSNMAISISGETGVGKDLLAKAVHYNSSRRDKRFISVNCAALPESLLESELFGYKKGAFTGADRDKPGLFEEADGGTFFLDEIADMPMSIQAKLLRVLENQEIIRLGDTRPRKVDVRVISATNKDLKEEMEARRFRSDLYYRLCALSFRIPPLRERKEDIPLLVDHFLAESKCRMSPDAMKYLIDFLWPGNVRELENEVKKLILLANNEGTIGPSLLSSRIVGSDMIFAAPGNGDDTTDGDGFSLYDYLATYEKRFIIKALKENKGIKKRAAEALNIPESTLRLKLKQYNIDPKQLGSLH